MAWKRDIPFGYMVRGGVLQPDPQEADAVKLIFAQYRAGASLLAIVEDMTRRGIRYHRNSDQWNKNMVKRILENAKYTGAEGWPRLVSEESFTDVQRQRTERNTYAPLAEQVRPICRNAVCARCCGRLARGTRSHGRVHWKCKECGQSVSISDESLVQQVDRRFRELTEMPNLLTAPEPQRAAPDMDAIRLRNELTMALNRGTETPEYMKTLILAAAAQRYKQLPDPTPAHELDRLRARLEGGPADVDMLADLLSTAVWAVQLTPEKNVTLELINGAIISEKKEAQSA